MADLDRASTHLINELKVPAIVGPNVSQDVITVPTSTRWPAHGGAVADRGRLQHRSLTDNDLTWIMVPSDVQRAPLMINQIGEIEAELRTQRPDRPIKLSIVHRSDALGMDGSR